MSKIIGPSLVLSNLVLHLDAANPKSYTSGSTSWYDMSGNGNTGTLVSGSGYSSANFGSITFDGVNDYVNNVGNTSSFSFIQNSGIYTISTWIKPSVLGTDMYFAGNNSGTRLQKGFYFGKELTNNCWFVLTNGTSIILDHKISGFFSNTTDWVYVTCVGDGVKNQFYRNGIPTGSTSNFSTLSTGNSSQTLALGSINDVNSYTYWWNGNISSFIIYNRSLSQQEILQNYNALKSRFGL